MTHRLLPILALLTALWDGPGRAVITWRQPDGLHCLYRQPAIGARVLVRCFAEPGGYGVTLEAGDAAYKPQAGDVYILRRPDGTKEETRLSSRVYLAAVAR